MKNYIFLKRYYLIFHKRLDPIPERLAFIVLCCLIAGVVSVPFFVIEMKDNDIKLSIARPVETESWGERRQQQRAAKAPLQRHDGHPVRPGLWFVICFLFCFFINCYRIKSLSLHFRSVVVAVSLRWMKMIIVDFVFTLCLGMKWLCLFLNQ